MTADNRATCGSSSVIDRRYSCLLSTLWAKPLHYGAAIVSVIVVLNPELGVKYCGNVATPKVTRTKLLFVERFPFELIRVPLRICVFDVRSLSVPFVHEATGVKLLDTAGNTLLILHS